MLAWGFLAAVLLANFAVVTWMLRVGLRHELQNYFERAGEPGPPANSAPDAELAKLRQNVATYPTELRYRYELGVALCRRQDHGAAIPELQRAMGSPHFRSQAMTRLVEAFEARGMPDLAASVRELLSRESGDDGEAGSAPVPAPTRPRTPRDSSQAKKMPDKDDLAD